MGRPADPGLRRRCRGGGGRPALAPLLGWGVRPGRGDAPADDADGEVRQNTQSHQIFKNIKKIKQFKNLNFLISKISKNIFLNNFLLKNKFSFFKNFIL